MKGLLVELKGHLCFKRHGGAGDNWNYNSTQLHLRQKGEITESSNDNNFAMVPLLSVRFKVHIAIVLSERSSLPTDLMVPLIWGRANGDRSGPPDITHLLLEGGLLALFRTEYALGNVETPYHLSVVVLEWREPVSTV